jgi:hypothetical protein
MGLGARFAVAAILIPCGIAVLYIGIATFNPPTHLLQIAYQTHGSLGPALPVHWRSRVPINTCRPCSRRGHEGAEGTYNFDKNGDDLHGYNVVRNDKGNIVFDRRIDFYQGWKWPDLPQTLNWDSMTISLRVCRQGRSMHWQAATDLSNECVYLTHIGGNAGPNMLFTKISCTSASVDLTWSCPGFSHSPKQLRSPAAVSYFVEDGLLQSEPESWCSFS